jgi:two-component system phosphate regulon sensor histidine kinase PhoR
MADAIGQLLAQAEQGKAELLTILASMSEGVIATDGQQCIRLVNEAAGRLLGFAAEQANGKALWQVVRNDRMIKAAGEVMAGGESRVVETGPIGGRHVEVRLSRYRSRGEAEGLVVVAYDTTHLVRYQELRKEFVANVSHELRTPLSVVRGFAETLVDGAMRDPVKGPEYLGAILRHTEQLTNLVNDLLALSRLESQPELPRRAKVDLGAAGRKIVEMLLPVAQKKRQTLTVDVAAGLPSVVGDPDYLERGIANLVDNAIKYTGEGGKIEVVVRADEENVVVEVRDNGIGIPAADLGRIFERFYRVDRSRSREMGGTGLGLAIVKHVAQVHGGAVEVESEVAKGSVFRMKVSGRWEEG